MDRRCLLLASLGACVPFSRARAHHGWGSFDNTRPIYLSGEVKSVRWQNPHAEFVLVVSGDATLPPDLKDRNVPPQTAGVDAKAILGKASAPRRKDREWTIELAPLTRMDAWKIAPLKAGEKLAVVGFTFPEEKGAAILRAEFLFRGGGAYGLRSSPA
jgi:hypothetical protein